MDGAPGDRDGSRQDALNRRLGWMLALHVPLVPLVAVPGAIAVHAIERAVGGDLPSPVIVPLAMMTSIAGFCAVLWPLRRDPLRALHVYLAACAAIIVALVVAHALGASYPLELLRRYW